MKITKQEILDLVKNNGLGEEAAEQLLELIGKGIGNSLLDLLKLLAEKSENQWDDMIVAAAEPKLREMVKDIEIEL